MQAKLIMYFQATTSVGNIEVPVERISNKSLNLGFSYRPSDTIELALDIRNLLDKEEQANGEVHLGFEKIFLQSFP